MTKEIQEKYANICLKLGDIDVKIQGLKNIRDELFKQLEELDEEAKESKV